MNQEICRGYAHRRSKLALCPVSRLLRPYPIYRKCKRLDLIVTTPYPTTTNSSECANGGHFSTSILLYKVNKLNNVDCHFYLIFVPLLYGQPLLSERFSKSRGWRLYRGPTVLTPPPPPIIYPT